MKTAGMFHYDLDGVSSDILLSKIFPFDTKYTVGYSKIEPYILDGKLEGYDAAIIADISLTRELFQKMTEEYNDRFMYFDHHKSTELIPEYKSTVIFDTTFSATAIIYQQSLKNSLFTKLKSESGILDYVIAVDSYDMWRVQTHPESFSQGYDLNILFWWYGYNDFYDRFSEDLSLNFFSDELKAIDTHKDERDKVMDDSDKTEFGDRSVVIFDAELKYINDFTLCFPDYAVYYMIYTTSDGMMTISVRSSLPEFLVDVGEACSKIKEQYEEQIISAGGHPLAAGVNFKKDIDMDLVLEVIEKINDRIESENAIPF